MRGMMDDPLAPHTHEPNPHPPAEDAFFDLVYPDGTKVSIDWGQMEALPRWAISNCYIVSSGHGRSGPFTFAGTPLLLLLQHLLPPDTHWSQVELVSADGFGTRIFRMELMQPVGDRPILVCDQRDGKRLSRAEGWVRLIVPSETNDALRQVKWLKEIKVHSS